MINTKLNYLHVKHHVCITTGLDKMHSLTQLNSVARIYFTDWDDTLYCAEYSHLTIDNEASKYRLSISGVFIRLG